MNRGRILFVCSGNTCRSPLAEVIARAASEEKGLSQLKILSSGTGASQGSPASLGALKAARRHGLDLSSHSSVPLTPELVQWADLILTMGLDHLRRVEDLGGAGKSQLLRIFAQGGALSQQGEAQDGVLDPFGGDDQVYESTFETLERYVGMALDRLKAEWSS